MISFGKNISIFIFTFLFVLSPSFLLLGSNLPILLLFFLSLLMLNKISFLLRLDFIYFFSFFFLICAVSFLNGSFFYHTNDLQIFRPILNIIFSIYFGGLLFLLADNKDSFFYIKIFVFAVLINSIIIILESFFLEFKLFIESFLQQGTGNINYSDPLGFRARGLATGGGAKLSVLHALGALSTIYLQLNNKINHFFGVFIVLCTLFSILFIGRTGLLVFILGLLIISITQSLKQKKVITFFLSGFIASLLIYIFVLIAYATLPEFLINYTLDNFSSFEALIAEGTFEFLYESYILPSNFFELFLGVGSSSGSFLSGSSDPGIMRAITSYGILFSSIIYASIFFLIFMFLTNDKNNGWDIILIFAILLFIAEFKEPMLMTGYSSRIMFLLVGFNLYKFFTNNGYKYN